MRWPAGALAARCRPDSLGGSTLAAGAARRLGFSPVAARDRGSSRESPGQGLLECLSSRDLEQILLGGRFRPNIASPTSKEKERKRLRIPFPSGYRGNLYIARATACDRVAEALPRSALGPFQFLRPV